MNETPVEDRDKELVQKFRSVVNRKERRKKSRTAVRVSAVAAGLALLFFVAWQWGLAPEPRMEADTARLAPSSNPAPPPAASSSEAEDITGGQSRIPVKKRRYPTPSGSIAAIAAPSGGIRVTEIIACGQVKDRRYLSPATVFSIKKDARSDIWVWMELTADRKAIPCTLRHAWYLEGRKYAEVPLTIAHPAMRTWSHMRLNRPLHVGRWRVAVITEQGEIISQVEFTVTP